MEENSVNPAHHGTPLLRILALLFFALLIAVISSLTTYYFLNKQLQTSIDESYLHTASSQTNPPPTEISKIGKSETPALQVYDYSGLYKLVNPNHNVNIKVRVDQTVDNFTFGAVEDINGGGAVYLWKKDGNVWTELFKTQFAWSCKVLLDNKIPPINNDGDCVFYGQKDCKGYEKECSKKDITKDRFNYKDLYKEHFGS